jgi:hypothetical protein
MCCNLQIRSLSQTNRRRITVTTANRKGNEPKKKRLPSAFTQSKSAKQKRRLKMEMEAYSTELGFTEEVLILNVRQWH